MGRLHHAGIALRTGFDDLTAEARQNAHRIASKPQRSSDDARAYVLPITGQLADLADTSVNQAKRALRI